MRGYFGIGIEGVSKPMNLGSLLRTAHAFNASFVFTIGAMFEQREVLLADTSDAAASLPLHEYKDLASFELPRGCRLVGVELLDEAAELPSFRHPGPGRLCAGRRARQPVARAGRPLRPSGEDSHPLLHQCRHGRRPRHVRPDDLPRPLRRAAGADRRRRSRS